MNSLPNADNISIILDIAYFNIVQQTITVQDFTFKSDSSSFQFFTR